MDIGGPTDVRVIDVSDFLPGLTYHERKQIREEASSGALRLQSLQSHPPLSFPETSLNGSNSRLQSIATDPVQSASTEADAISSHYPSSDVFPEADSVMAHAAALDAGPGAEFSSASTRSEDEHGADVVRMKDVEKGERRHGRDASSPRSSHEMDAEDKKHRVGPSHALSLNKGTDAANLEKEERDAHKDLSATGRGGKDMEVEQIHNNHIVGSSFTTGETKVLVAC
ncbi:uncharacterized protein J4E78_001077 [Alternaria triticimaculans]|uniref:uncharacterized protein n=1 Tax=Alternaria triticimaculans TaxID=297637 RepID=UPI0020C4E65E|nr:uncharacterized protein J4E78_001077 [Alternaria triticimaculans]KAI4672576.1 hypothetical protein J4E78_001077 [Alternaria triticimaculans]